MKRKNAYLVGIKGVAMTALAVYLKQQGYEVLGSDVEEVFPTDNILKEQGIKVKKGFDAQNINKDFDLVVVTGAHGGMTNIEAKRAREIGLLTLMHGEMVGRLMEGKTGISVAGCHGKTTTSSMTAFLLHQGGYNPSYLIGTPKINDLGPAGHYALGDIIVVEADEYLTCPKTCPKPRFLWQKPKIAVITNIEYDHPDAFGNISQVEEAFLAFAQKVKKNGTIVACVDNESIRNILPKIENEVITYGFSQRADFCIEKFSFTDYLSFMRIRYKNIEIGDFTLKVAGKHNLLNALAAGITVNLLGESWEKVRQNIRLYSGCKRRLEKIGRVAEIDFFDDYAHHPSEIKATLCAVRNWYPQKRIIVVFQPHTFSRTKVLINEFARSFEKADIVIIPDIYPSAREKYDSSITSVKLVMEINRYKKNAVYKKSKKEVISYLEKNILANDLIITMGAGNIYGWHRDLLESLRNKFHE
jgi:UDP-N-acetylmuramate--alanine ligase